MQFSSISHQRESNLPTIIKFHSLFHSRREPNLQAIWKTAHVGHEAEINQISLAIGTLQVENFIRKTSQNTRNHLPVEIVHCATSAESDRFSSGMKINGSLVARSMHTFYLLG